jgi:hypothetical protein
MKSLIILVFVSCLGVFSSVPIKFVSATKYDWAGGRKEGGKGTKYTFHFVAGKSSELLKLNCIYLGKKCYDIEAFKIEKDNSWNKSFKSSDTLIINISQTWMRNEKDEFVEVQNFQIKNPPIQFKGDALLEYSYKNKKNYVIIPKIQNTQNQQYQ